MSQGTITIVNKAMIRPVMIAGVEKKLVVLNSLLSFPLLAATHFHFPACLLGILFFLILHSIGFIISKHDPHLGRLFKRSTRYALKPYFPARSHPLMTAVWSIKSVARE